MDCYLAGPNASWHVSLSEPTRMLQTNYCSTAASGVTLGKVVHCSATAVADFCTGALCRPLQLDLYDQRAEKWRWVANPTGFCGVGALGCSCIIALCDIFFERASAIRNQLTLGLSGNLKGYGERMCPHQTND